MQQTQLLDRLDQLLEDYLELLNTYQTLHASLQRNLKQGHFNLAKSKLALGPHVLAQRNWDLKERRSQVEILIQGEPAAVNMTDRELHEPTSADNQNNSLLSWSLRARSSSPSVSQPESTEASNAPSLRQRQRPHATSVESMSPTEPPHPNSVNRGTRESLPPIPRPHSRLDRSPLDQFSAFPPPALRSAAQNFESGLSDVVRVVELERKLRGLGKEIKVLKKQIKVGTDRGLQREGETEEDVDCIVTA